MTITVPPVCHVMPCYPSHKKFYSSKPVQNYHWPQLDNIDDDLYLHSEFGGSLHVTFPLGHKELVMSPLSNIHRWDPSIDEPEFQRDVNLPSDGI